jgi:hypothetical protein
VRQQADYDVGEISWTRMDAGGTPGEVLERALRRLGHIL